MLIRILLVCCLLFTLAACQNQIKEGNEVEITGFAENSALQDAGALTGDEIVSYNGIPVHSVQEINEIKERVASDMVNVVLLRDGKQVSIEVPRGQLGVYLKEWKPEHAIDDDAVVIDGIKSLRWETGMENSFLGTVFRLDEKFGRGISYTDIVGLSGYGFRTQFYDGWCPSSPDATTGFNCGERILDILGYRYKFYWLDEMKNAPEEGCDDGQVEYRTKEEMLELIQDGINGGYPVIAIDLIDIPEWGLITGYQKEGSELFVRSYYDSTRGYDLAEKFPWVICVIDGYRELPLEDRYEESLKLARELYVDKSYGPYFSGLNAVENWMKALIAPDFGEVSKVPQKENMVLGNWWITQSLKEARGTAAEYLLSNIDRFQRSGDEIRQMAEFYEREASLLKESFLYMPNPFQQSAFESWSPEDRRKQHEILALILKIEKEVYRLL